MNSITLPYLGMMDLYNSSRSLAYLALFIVLSVVLLSCTSTTELQRDINSYDDRPITVTESKSISFHKIAFNIKRGQTIGYHKEGLARVTKDSHTWTIGVVSGSGEFKKIINQELSNYGYSVPSGGDLLFEEDETSKARLQIGAEVSEVIYNTYGPLAGGFEESAMNVSWQVYDSSTENVVYESNLTGYSKSSDGSNPISEAFYDSFYKLASSEDFVEVTPVDEDRASIQANGSTTISIDNKENDLTLPSDIDKVNSSVVTITTGNVHGSGFFIDSEGYILTAEHVVSGVDNVQIVTNQGLSATAKVVRSNPKSDISLLKVDGSNFDHLEINTDYNNVGAEVFAVGTPVDESLSNSVSKGIISQYRTIDGIPFIQTDASLNSGNSGGPTLNKDGEVVGIVSKKLSTRAGFEGLAFCVDIGHSINTLDISFDN